MRRIKRVFFGFLVLVLLIQGLVLVVELLVKRNLPGILNNSSNNPSVVSFEDISFSFWKRSIEIEHISVKQKASAEEDASASLEAEIGRVEIDQVRVFGILFNKVIKAGNVFVEEPNFRINSSKEGEGAMAKNSKPINNFWKDFYSSIELQNIEVRNGKLLGTSNSIDTLFKVDDFDFLISEVQIDSSKIVHPIPFEFEKFDLVIGGIQADISPLYRITLDSLSVSEEDLVLRHLNIEPLLSKQEFSKHIDMEQDYITAHLDSLKMLNSNWGFIQDQMFVKSDELWINGLSAQFYRDKTVKDNLKKKKLFARIMRDLPFKMNFKKFHISDSNIEIQEKSSEEREVASLSINDIRVDGLNLSNYNPQGFVKIEFSGNLLDDALINGELKFKVNDLKDSYVLTGKVSKMNLSKLNSYSQPTFNVKLSGVLNSIDYQIVGNDIDAHATMHMDLENIDIEVLNKKQNKRKLISAAGNLLLKNSVENQEVKSTNERKQDKSVFNQIILCFVSSIKKAVLIL